MNEFIKKGIYKIILKHGVDFEKADFIIEDIDKYMTPAEDEDNLPRSLEVKTALFTGWVYLSEAGGKFSYKDNRGGTILGPTSKKIMRSKIALQRGRED